MSPNKFGDRKTRFSSQMVNSGRGKAKVNHCSKSKLRFKTCHITAPKVQSESKRVMSVNSIKKVLAVPTDLKSKGGQ